MKNLENLSYKMQLIDTMMSGFVGSRSGSCSMIRVTSDSLFGFNINSKRTDIDAETYYVESTFYSLNSATNTYTSEDVPIDQTLNFDGSKMILPELVQKISNYNSIGLNETDSSYILTFGFPYEMSFQRTLVLHLFKESLIPFYRYYKIAGFDNKQVNIAVLSEIKINDPQFVNIFQDKKFLDGYAVRPKETSTNKLYTLIDTPASDFELSNLQNNSSKLSDQNGKVMLIDFWEVWCSPCIRSIPQLNELSTRYPKSKFEIWSIISDSISLKKIETVVKTSKINYTVLLGNRELKKKYHVDGVPLYLVIDKVGKIKHAQYGYTPEIDKVIEHLID